MSQLAWRTRGPLGGSAIAAFRRSKSVWVDWLCRHTASGTTKSSLHRERDAYPGISASKNLADRPETGSGGSYLTAELFLGRVWLWLQVLPTAKPSRDGWKPFSAVWWNPQLLQKCTYAVSPPWPHNVTPYGDPTRYHYHIRDWARARLGARGSRSLMIASRR